MTPLRAEVVRDQAGLLQLAPQWDALVARARIAHPFSSHDWVRTWWECFGAGRELCVIAVRSGDELIALAPLMRNRASMYGLAASRLELMVNVHTPRFDFIVAERSEEALASILDCLSSLEERWDILVLPELPGTSSTITMLERLAPSRELFTGTWVAGASPRVSLVGTFETYLAGLSTKRRAVLRQRLRRLQALGPVSMEVVAQADALAGALEDAFRIEAASWKGAAGTAIARSEQLKRFYSLIAERAAASRTLSLMFLKVGERRIAFGYCLRAGRTLFLLKQGYDPEYATYSPFNTLMSSIIESAYRDGLEVFDLLGCDEPWKRDWAAETTERRWLFLHRNTLRGLVIYSLKFVITPLLKATLPAHALAAVPSLVRGER